MNNNILLIDDNDCILETLVLRFGAYLQDWNILTAKDGKEGTKIMSSLPVSLVVTDLQMPDMDGYGVIEFRNRNYPLVPVIVMSGNVTSEVRGKLRGLNVYECFEKPFDFDKLFRQVVGIISVGVDSESGAINANSDFYTQSRVA
jgi:DNA-binding NtrC family response regulator